MAKPKKSIWTKNGQTCPACQPPKVVQKGLKCAERSIWFFLSFDHLAPMSTFEPFRIKNWFFWPKKKEFLIWPKCFGRKQLVFCLKLSKWHKTGPQMNHYDYCRSVLWAAHGHFFNMSENNWKRAKDIFIGGKLAPCDSRLIDRFALRTPIAYKQPIKTDSQAIHLYIGQRSNKHPISSLYLLMILNLWQKIE